MRTIENNTKTSNRSIYKTLPYFILAILTFGAAIYGIINFEKRGIIYQGNFYEEIDSFSFKNKSGHRITVEEKFENNDTKISIIIENDNVLIKYSEKFGDIIIDKNGEVFTSSILSDLEPASTFRDYFELAESYFKLSNIKSEFPSGLIYPLLAIFAFISGFFIIRYFANKKEQSKSTLAPYYLSINFLIFIFTYGLLLLFINQNS